MNKPLRDRSELDQPNYTIPAAARRVGRSERTIKRWLADGMPCREVTPRRVVIDHKSLMVAYREHLTSNPSHRIRDTPKLTRKPSMSPG